MSYRNKYLKEKDIFSQRNKSNTISNDNHDHYSDVTMSAMASQITGVSIICSIVCSNVDRINHQSSRQWPLWPVDSLHKGPVKQKSFHLITSSWTLKSNFRALLTKRNIFLFHIFICLMMRSRTKMIKIVRLFCCSTVIGMVVSVPLKFVYADCYYKKFWF